MPILSRQTGPIVVYGATGYTGRLVVAELAQAGADFVVAGRNQAKLEELREALELDAPIRTARVNDPDSLHDLFADCSVVIACAGPFVRYGEPVLRAAVETSTHYLDTTGEQSYMKLAFERYGPGAAEAEVAVIPAMGFDYVPGDMIASITAEGMGEIDEVLLAYAWRDFAPTQGTTNSAFEILSSDMIEWRNMEWRKPSGGFGRGHYDFPAPFGRQRMISYPAGEQITVPRHIATRNVRTTMNVAPFMNIARIPSDRVAGLFTATMGPTALAMRTPLKAVARAVASRLPEGPSTEQRQRMQWMIACEARRGEVRRRAVISGRDVYGLTGATVANGAMIVARSGFDGRGALAPSQAFEPKDFLGKLDRFDVQWELSEGPAEPVEA